MKDEFLQLIEMIFSPNSYPRMMAPTTAYGKTEQEWKEIIMTLKDPSSHPDPKQIWLHVKTGNYYVILHHGLFESSLKPMVIYQRVDGSGPVWVRPAEQFFDGRFRNWE